MSGPTIVRAADVSRHQSEAIAAKVIYVTEHDQIVGAYYPADELDHHRSLKAREREVLIVGELDDETIADVTVAEFGAPAA
jgi:hypothetical protein